MLAKVAIIGRSNVGKSTLMNRLMSPREGSVIVSPAIHTTRDRNAKIVCWDNVDFELIDTPGVDHQKTQNGLSEEDQAVQRELEENIEAQAKIARARADIILFMTDIQEGILPQEKKLIGELKKQRSGKTIFLVLNKADNPLLQKQIRLYSNLFGEENTFAISARNGFEVDALIDHLVREIKNSGFETIAPREASAISVAIIGKTNTGKSSLFNSIVKEERSVVSQIPHTTRDPQDTSIIYRGARILFIDTAGLRKRSKVKKKSVEEISAKKTLLSLKKAKIALFVIDISKELTKQDLTISDLISREDAGLIIAANKWDIIPDKNPSTINSYNRYILRSFPAFAWAKIIFCSAVKNIGVPKLLDAILEINEEIGKKIPQEDLAYILQKSIKKHLPSRGKGIKQPKIFRITQREGSIPPIFDLFIKKGTSLHSSYLGFLKNKIREKFGFHGVPIFISVKKALK